jgi:hypothetical protein
MFRTLLGRGHLDLRPPRYEVYEDLRLDRFPGAKLNFKLSKLVRPLDNAAFGIPVASGLSQGE